MEERKNKSVLKKSWLGGIALIIAIGLSGCGSTTSTNNSGTTPAPETKVETPKDTKKVTMEKYLQVTMGMSYEDVKKILGDGIEQASVDAAGTNTKAYGWQNDDGTNMMVTLQNDKVTSKAQAGLGKNDAKVTLDKYNQIKEGMTVEEVKGILGEGQETSYTEMVGTKIEMYSWINFDGANMNATFQDGKMNMKAQFGLK